MTAPNFQTTDATETENLEGTAPIDNTPEGSDIGGSTPTTSAVPAIDPWALYRESLAERRRMEQELEEARQRLNAPKPQDEEEITDEYFEKHGTAKGLTKIVRSQVATLLKESLGDIGEISQDFKRGKQLSAAEEKFFQSYPHLVNFKDQLAGPVRNLLSNAPSVDPATYERTALAAIGYMTVNNMMQQPAAPTTQTAPVTTPSAPTQRATASQVRKPTRRLTEFERTAMRKSGFNPDDSKSVEEFFAIVENEDGVTV